jgi:hypothetical protein
VSICCAQQCEPKWLRGTRARAMPVKFDDIPKVATEVLNDDHQTSGYVLKAKQKTNYGGMVLSTQVDFAPVKDGKGVATPSKLTWKWPAPLGVGQICIDKLELDKGGKFKLEGSSDKAYPGLKIECKSDLASLNKVMAGCTYTGLKDAQVKFECKAMNPKEFTGEVTYTRGIATCGLKTTSAGTPELGIRLLSGPFFCSLLAQDNFKTFKASAFYKANPDFKCAATMQHGGKADGSFTVGVAYKGLGKIKVTHDQTVSCSVKHDLAKGFTILTGASYNVQKGNTSCGMQLSIE